MNSIDSLIKKLGEVGEINQIEYPYNIRAILSKKISSKNSVHIKNLTRIFKDESLSGEIRFNAFYAAQVFLWRLKEFEAYRYNVDVHEKDFGQNAFFETFRAQYYMSKDSSQFNNRMAMEYAEKALVSFQNLPNVITLYVTAVLNYFELEPKNSDLNILQRAEKNISSAISLSKGEYAKYFSLRARIYLLLEEYNKAKEDIRLAIEKEPSESREYTIRIGEYQEVRSRISNSEHIRNVKLEHEKAMHIFDNLRSQMIQLIGILAAIVAFIVATVNIAQGYDFKEASKLIVINGLVCVLIFSCFHMIFLDNILKRKTVLLIVFSSSIISVITLWESLLILMNK